jgi:hypothetical protein
MGVRRWLSISVLVVVAGCGGSGADDGAADGGLVPGDAREDLDASKSSDASKPSDASEPSDASKPSDVDATRPAGEPDSGPGTGGTTGARDASTALCGDTDCEWTDGNLNMCRVCANDSNCEAATYTDSRDGTVTSSCCGLVWQRVVDGDGAYNLEQAAAYCAELELAGGGWRLPTIAELSSLVVLGQTPESPAIDRTAFPNTPVSGPYWSCSPWRGSDRSAWNLYFFDGSSNGNLATGLRHVRCVR